MAPYKFCLGTVTHFVIIHYLFWVQPCLASSSVRWSNWESCIASQIYLEEEDGGVILNSNTDSTPRFCVSLPPLILPPKGTSIGRQPLVYSIFGDPSGIDITSSTGMSIRFEVLEASVNMPPYYLYVKYLKNSQTRSNGQETG